MSFTERQISSENRQNRQPYNHVVIVRVPSDVRPTCQLTCSLPVRPVITHTYLQCIYTSMLISAMQPTNCLANDTLDDWRVGAIMSTRRRRTKHLLWPVHRKCRTGQRRTEVCVMLVCVGRVRYDTIMKYL